MTTTDTDTEAAATTARPSTRAALIEAGIITPDDTVDEAAEKISGYRAAVLREAADALLAVDPVEWALAGQHAGSDAAALLRRMAEGEHR